MNKNDEENKYLRKYGVKKDLKNLNPRKSNDILE